ncbi:MAG: CheR family methyltransferase [Lautropia sp.]
MSDSAILDRTREYAYTNADFRRVRSLIHQRAGISLADGKQNMVYARLAPRLRETGKTTFDAYLDALASQDAPEWGEFTNALTTNLTSFFREQHHFPILADHLARCWRERGEPLTIWCSAASTGEEPYTIAITAIEALGRDAGQVRILATDIDTGVLARAEAGVYRMDQLRAVSPERLQRFFLRGRGGREGFVKVRDELRERITFRQLNLIAPSWPMKGRFDAILCRNVMIYFDKPTQRRLLERFAPLLRPDGLLFAGHSESFSHAADLFRPRGSTVYSLA